MIKHIKIRANGNAICQFEDGSTKEYDLLKPLITKLTTENLITGQTKIIDVFNFETSLDAWYANPVENKQT